MRPKTVDQDKLGEGVRIRLTELEKRLLLKRSQREGYRTLSDFCRAKLVKKREIRKIEVSDEFVMITKKLDYDLNKIGVNINQLARNINAQQVYQFTTSDREIFMQVLQELRNCFSVLQNYVDIIE
ncbi:plasmid mobilization relaxosome protein MobC [Ancylomarina sp. 16SWW S1-10-2]|uniref:plasmid mobilization protein n=1 Tax=Ancylomarina sp. 16SWW S1-10-2 TaxID=2499681 RepID=UPI0012AE2FCC|nr:plasmid mobilization relaxosome protein MobC [Ancylomarina sp. 16SWW S1-10-2]MRT92044.1 plasmid mobilization relaxosome protein MobC [Ancylomarina sp. 16SWW S1-10-2]